MSAGDRSDAVSGVCVCVCVCVETESSDPVPDNDDPGDAHYETKFITRSIFEETEHPPKVITQQKH